MTDDELFDGLIITGSPVELSRWIQHITSKKASFSYWQDPTSLDESIVVHMPGSESFLPEAPPFVSVSTEVETSLMETTDILPEPVPDPQYFDAYVKNPGTSEAALVIEEMREPKSTVKRGRRPKAALTTEEFVIVETPIEEE